MKLFGLVLLLLSFDGCSAEVVQSFDQCNQFFANIDGTPAPPTTFNGDEYKIICQTLKNTPCYVTYYNTSGKIPVYSAYRFGNSGFLRRLKSTWFIEPQLDDNKKGPNMKRQEDVRNHAVLGMNQALYTDYTNSSYSRGHLAPRCYASSQDCARATFTLTNIAPQIKEFNSGAWNQAEQRMLIFLQILTLALGGNAYVVTGVVPGENKLNNTNVTVPSHFWTACCYDNEIFQLKLSGAYYGANSVDSDTHFVSLEELELFLTLNYNRGSFEVFDGRCHMKKKPPSLNLLYIALGLSVCASVVIKCRSRRHLRQD